jgi:hypothetical protein
MNRIRISLLLLASWIASATLTAAELHLGAATVDITPDEPVALSGQRNVRISKKPETPIQASAIALESREGDRVLDSAIMVSCDLVAIRQGVLEQTREKLATLAPDFPLEKLFLAATHTHTAPVMIEGRYHLPAEGIMQPAAFVDFLTTRLAQAAAEAWKNRAPGRVAWGQSHAVLARNRRPYYADGTAVMYGKTDTPEFRGIEGYEDHSVDVLFFHDNTDRLVATIVNVPCPAQEVGGGTSIHADFWDPTRRLLREKHGDDLHIIAWTGASGDVTSRDIVNKPADERMRRLRGNISRLDELAARLVRAWEEAYEGAKNDLRDEVVLRHQVATIDLPYRIVTPAERAAAAAEAAKFKDDPAQRWNWRWNQGVVDRYEAQQAGTQEPYRMELHALRLGDVAIATNDFELYTDFGIQMKTRSPAVQTFIVQLAGPGTYLPTGRAAAHGGYGAVIQSSQIGPAGGQVLVEETVARWKELWVD